MPRVAGKRKQGAPLPAFFKYSAHHPEGPDEVATRNRWSRQNSSKPKGEAATGDCDKICLSDLKRPMAQVAWGGVHCRACFLGVGGQSFWGEVYAATCFLSSCGVSSRGQCTGRSGHAEPKRNDQPHRVLGQVQGSFAMNRRRARAQHNAACSLQPSKRDRKRHHPSAYWHSHWLRSQCSVLLSALRSGSRRE